MKLTRLAKWFGNEECDKHEAVAHHEAGHAVMGIRLGHKVLSIEVKNVPGRPGGRPGERPRSGRTYLIATARWGKLPKEQTVRYTAAGLIAGYMYDGISPGDDAELLRTLRAIYFSGQLAVSAAGDFEGLYKAVRFRNASPHISLAALVAKWREVEAEVKELWPVITAVAQELMTSEDGVISGERVHEIYKREVI